MVVNRCRRLARTAPSAPLPPSLPTGDARHDHERSLVVRQALDSLPESERMAVLLFHVGQYSRGEVATFLGVSEVAVKKRLASGRARLRERLLAMLEDDLRQDRPSNTPDFAARVLAFTKLFSALVSQGTSLIRSLGELARQENDPEFRAAIEGISREIQAGSTLSQAMRGRPRFFGEAYLRAIREGEMTGTLEAVLEGLAQGTYGVGSVPILSWNHAGARNTANGEARRRGHSAVTPEHQLLGLLLQEQSRAVRDLVGAGVDVPALRSAAASLLDGVPAFEGEPHATAEAQAVRRAAFNLAAAEGTTDVGTQFLLRALLEAEGTEAARLLRAAGAYAAVTPSSRA
jgi:hypothetical protein